MIGIYQDSFIDYLKDKLGDNVRRTIKNIIIPCPWCEFNEDKDHYHLYIANDAPMFHCFHASCEISGNLRKLLKKLEGHDISDKFVDKESFSKIQKKRVFVKDEELRQVVTPKLKPSMFPYKDMYVKKRLKFANVNMKRIKGLIYDVYEFIRINQIPVNETLFRLQDYLHSNFVGFLTEHDTTAMFRNIDHSQSMAHFKLKIQSSSFVDYYKLPGGDYNSKTIVLAEGIYDIFSEQIHDFTNIKDKVKLYASALSSKYQSLIQSIVYHEQIFKPDIIILSDKGIDLDYYKRIKKFNKHIINTMTVYYNKTGKDFNDTPVTPSKFVI